MHAQQEALLPKRRGGHWRRLHPNPGPATTFSHIIWLALIARAQSGPLQQRRDRFGADSPGAADIAPTAASIGPRLFQISPVRCRPAGGAAARPHDPPSLRSGTGGTEKPTLNGPRSMWLGISGGSRNFDAILASPRRRGPAPASTQVKESSRFHL